jgi:ankyrin repeat protein
MVETGRTKIGMAAHQGNIRQVESLVFEGASTNQPDEVPPPPLCVSLYLDDLRLQCCPSAPFGDHYLTVVRHAASQYGETPLHMAAAAGHMEMVRMPNPPSLETTHLSIYIAAASPDCLPPCVSVGPLPGGRM